MKKQNSVTTPTNDFPAFANVTSQKPTTDPIASQNDLFGIDLSGSSTSAQTNGQNSASDDLLMLSGPNPFFQNLVNQSYNTQPQMGFNTAPSGNLFQSSMMPLSQVPMGSMVPSMNSFPPMMQTTTNPMTNSNQLSKI